MEQEATNGGTKRPRVEAPRFFSIFQKPRPNSQRDPAEQSINSSDNSKEGNLVASRQIFCDLDGVLVDFEAGVTELRNAYDAKAKRQPPFQMWKAIRQTPHFYRTLPWMTDGKLLWEAIAPLQPHILTGVPWDGTAPRDKFDWCQKELTLRSQSWQWRNMVGSKKAHVRVNAHFAGEKSAKTPVTSTSDPFSSGPSTAVDSLSRRSPTVITCWSQNKPLECRIAGDILIDDRPENHDLRARWEQAGGIFIHHTSARETIRALVQFGVLSDDERKKRTATEEESDDVKGPENTAI